MFKSKQKTLYNVWKGRTWNPFIKLLLKTILITFSFISILWHFTSSKECKALEVSFWFTLNHSAECREPKLFINTLLFMCFTVFRMAVFLYINTFALDEKQHINDHISSLTGIWCPSHRSWHYTNALRKHHKLAPKHFLSEKTWKLGQVEASLTFYSPLVATLHKRECKTGSKARKLSQFWKLKFEFAHLNSRKRAWCL